MHTYVFKSVVYLKVVKWMYNLVELYHLLETVLKAEKK